MTDRELLELAAKSAGYIGYVVDEDEPWFRLKKHPPHNRRLGDDDYWNPITDDGDALRLAVQLGLVVATDFAGAVNVGVNNRQLCQEEIDGDPYAATRRAIVRAAAEIGRKLK